MSLHLSQDELIERTGYKQHPKQCKELARQGLKFTVRADGFPLVLRSQLEPQDRRRPNFQFKQVANG
jgi:hypothetical protein